MDLLDRDRILGVRLPGTLRLRHYGADRLDQAPADRDTYGSGLSRGVMPPRCDHCHRDLAGYS